MAFCPQCGFKTKEGDTHCVNCGYKLSDELETESEPIAPESKMLAEEEIPTTPQSSPSGPDQSFQNQIGVKQPDLYRLAPLSDRFFAFCIDSLIASGLATLLCIPGCLYTAFKDGYENGRSLGKSVMNLRVINFNTGQPGTYGQSCVRNCLDCGVCCGFLYLWVFVDSKNRRIGDYFAETIVIIDE
ncbi:MAG: RDD family protein [Candidatus Hodarchaeales archaeon]